MGQPLLDLRLYVDTVDVLQAQAEEWHNEAGAPSYVHAVRAWCQRLELSDEEREYVLEGLMRLAGNYIKGGGWETRPPEPELDVRLWTFYRAWVDHYGPFYPPDTTPLTEPLDATA